jgi:mRNA-degrading endonuclease RelE of RelBE toxin-antitoxin system
VSAAYRVFIANSVIHDLRKFRRAEQDLITRILDGLSVDPFRRGDYVEQDEIGRPIQVLLIGRFALFYWADHSAKEVKITDLRAAGN